MLIPRTKLNTYCIRFGRLFCWLGWIWVLISVGLAYRDLQDRWVEPGHDHISVFKLWIYWSTWASIPLLLEAILHLRIKPHSIMRWLWLFLLAVVAYSGLLEPRLLNIHTHRIAIEQEARPSLPPLRIALVTDIHAGLFIRQWQLKRLVDTLNSLDVDAVIVTGDWVYEPPRDLLAVWSPLKRLHHPLFGVLGNHDTEAPGPALTAPLKQTLQQHGVQLLDGKTALFKGWELVGLADLWGGQPRKDIAQLLDQASSRPRLVMTHQPDTVALIPAHSAALIISGHTHGGQIWLPWITQNLVLTGMSRHGWYQGLYATAAGPLFVSAGTGQIGLPARLGVVPRIDVLELMPSQHHLSKESS